MPLKPYSRIENYFQKLDKIKSIAIDRQFNGIVSYLNKEVIPTLNTLTSAKIPGSINPADANKFLQNVGDYTTRWAAINNDSFADNSLSLDKLSKVNIGSILAGDSNGSVQSVNPLLDNQCLVSRAGNLPIWKKLNSSNIKARSITGDSVADATITNDNLPAYLIENLIADNSITGDKFRDNAINSSKIADSTLTAQKLSPDLAVNFARGVWSNIIPDNYLTTVNQIMKPYTHTTQSWKTIIRLFNDTSKPVLKYSDSIYGNSQGKPTINTVFPASKFTYDGNYWGFCAHHVHGRVNAATKLKDASIEAGRVMIGYKPSSPNYPNDFRAYVRKPAKNMVANGAVEMRHLTQYLRNKLEAAR